MKTILQAATSGPEWRRRRNLHQTTSIISPAVVQRIIDKHSGDRASLIPILEDIQACFNYLPKDALVYVSQQTGHSLVEIYGVATFYRAFALEPRGEHLISVCLGTACHVRGAAAVAKEFEAQLGVKAGGTTDDREFTLETAACLGACALGPIVVVDGKYFSNVRGNQVEGILAKARKGLGQEEVAGDERMIPLDVSCPRCNHTLIDPEVKLDGKPSIRTVVSFQRKHGSLRISSLYGSPSTRLDHEIPQDTVVDFFCPHCHAELIGGLECAKCSAPMIPMFVRGGGILQICSRFGCKEHRLDINGVNL